MPFCQSFRVAIARKEVQSHFVVVLVVVDFGLQGDCDGLDALLTSEFARARRGRCREKLS